jgi:hypothetical protein
VVRQIASRRSRSVRWLENVEETFHTLLEMSKQKVSIQFVNVETKIFYTFTSNTKVSKLLTSKPKVSKLIASRSKVSKLLIAKVV